MGEFGTRINFWKTYKVLMSKKILVQKILVQKKLISLKNLEKSLESLEKMFQSEYFKLNLQR